MPELTQIQMACHLQETSLFSCCDAKQTMRIAGIAQQQRYRQGEVIYTANDPAEAMFLIAEGRVRLQPPEEAANVLGANATFGVHEILSDRLRSERAEAAEDSLLIVIEAEDFFDLLSNNIEIVKSLFRRLLNPQDGKSDCTTAELAVGVLAAAD